MGSRLYRRLMIGLSLLGLLIHVVHQLGLWDPGPAIRFPALGSLDSTTTMVIVMWGLSAAFLIAPPAMAKVWGVAILQVFLFVNAPFAFWDPSNEVVKIVVRLLCGMLIVGILKWVGFLPRLRKWDPVLLYPIMFYGVTLGENYALAAGIELLSLGWSFKLDILSCIGCAMLWHSCATSLQTCADPGQRELLADWCVFNAGWVAGTAITTILWLTHM